MPDCLTEGVLFSGLALLEVSEHSASSVLDEPQESVEGLVDLDLEVPAFVRQVARQLVHVGDALTQDRNLRTKTQFNTQDQGKQ